MIHDIGREIERAPRVMLPEVNSIAEPVVVNVAW